MIQNARIEGIDDFDGIDRTARHSDDDNFVSRCGINAVDLLNIVGQSDGDHLSSRSSDLQFKVAVLAAGDEECSVILPVGKLRLTVWIEARVWIDMVLPLLRCAAN